MDVHFNSTKVKFEQMTFLLKRTLESRPIRTLNIFVSLDNLYGRLKSTKSNAEFQHSGINATKQLISNVLNLIGHYRQWGIRHHLDTRVYAYYSTSERSFENKIFVPGYRSAFMKKLSINHPDCYYVNTVMRDANPLLKTITSYVEGVYVIDSHITEPSVIPLFIEKDVRSADLNVIVTRDAYDFQYACVDKFAIIVPRGDDSFLINAGNLWETIAKREHFMDYDTRKFNPKLYTLALSAMGDKHRSVPKVNRISWITIFKFLNECASEEISDSTEVDKFLDLLSKNYNGSEVLMHNFTVCDIVSNYKNMDTTTKEYIKSQLIDVPDYDSLLTLNKLPNMFLNYPINLRFLTDVGDAHTGGNPFIK